MYKNPKTTVGAVIYSPLKGKNIILLTKRNIEPFKHHWCLPGGHIEYFENVLEAVKREIDEETSLAFDPGFLGYFEEVFPERDIHNVVLMFYGMAKGEPQKDDTEVSDIGWFSLNEALAMDLAFGHNEVLLAYKDIIVEGRNE